MALQTIYPIKIPPVRKCVSRKTFFPSCISLPYILCEKKLIKNTYYTLKKAKFSAIFIDYLLKALCCCFTRHNRPAHLVKAFYTISLDYLLRQLQHERFKANWNL